MTDGKTIQNMQSVISKIWDIVHLVGFTIEIYYDARSYKRQIWWNEFAIQNSIRGRSLGLHECHIPFHSLCRLGFARDDPPPKESSSFTVQQIK